MHICVAPQHNAGLQSMKLNNITEEQEQAWITEQEEAWEQDEEENLQKQGLGDNMEYGRT